MFDYDISQKTHFTGKDGETTYENWLVANGINADDFPFRVKTNRFTRRGHQIYLNVVSWGYYQGSDWRYYVFITYREGQGRYTCAYHWDVDSDGKPVGTPRKHEWVN